MIFLFLEILCKQESRVSRQYSAYEIKNAEKSTVTHTSANDQLDRLIENDSSRLFSHLQSASCILLFVILYKPRLKFATGTMFIKSMSSSFERLRKTTDRHQNLKNIRVRSLSLSLSLLSLLNENFSLIRCNLLHLVSMCSYRLQLIFDIFNPMAGNFFSI